MSKYVCKGSGKYIYHTSLDCSQISGSDYEEYEELDDRYPWRECDNCQYLQSELPD